MKATLRSGGVGRAGRPAQGFQRRPWQGHPSSSAHRPALYPMPVPRPSQAAREAPGWTLGFCTHITFPDFRGTSEVCSREPMLETLHSTITLQAPGRRGRSQSRRTARAPGRPERSVSQRPPGAPSQRGAITAAAGMLRAAGVGCVEAPGPPLGAHPLTHPDGPSRAAGSLQPHWTVC